MPQHKKPPEYFRARRAINQHLHRHHAGATSVGTLAHRLDEHEELHQLAKRLGIPIDHNHEPCEDGEDDVALALRLLEDGETQHGQSDTAARS